MLFTVETASKVNGHSTNPDRVERVLVEHPTPRRAFHGATAPQSVPAVGEPSQGKWEVPDSHDRPDRLRGEGQKRDGGR